MTPVPPRLLLVVFLFLCGFALKAQNGPELPPGKELAAPADFAASENAVTLLTVEREGHGEWKSHAVWVARTTEAAKDPWLAQLKTRLSQPVRKGDRALLLVNARAVETSHESDQAQLRLVVADEKKPFPRIATGQFSVDRQWHEIALPFAFGRDFAAGEIQVSLDLGYGRQAVELAGLRLLGFGSSVALESLPRTRITYVGHEADAPWRRDALERIEQIRKGDLAVLVTDAAGRPVSGAEVRVELVSHAFEFGTAVNTETFTQNTPAAEKYREHIAALFNAGTLENSLKWPNWAGDGKSADYRERTLQTLAWLKARDFTLRGHVMVWPGWRFLPAAIKALRDQPGQKEIPGLALAHIREIALATKDYISEWDVLNEPVNNHDLMDLFGREIMVGWFKEAAAAVPGVPLFLNDWGNHDQRSSPAHVQDFEDVARYLIAQGAPLGGLGLQGHVGGVLSAPPDLLATLDRYQKNLGLPVRVTEFDVTIDDEEIQADYTRDFLIAMFSHPSVVGVQFWGFWAGRHWQPQAALYRQDWTEKPNGAAYRKLVQETWHTDATGHTDAAGHWNTRGFYGRYTVTVTTDGKTHSATVKLAPGETGPLRITLPAGF